MDSEKIVSALKQCANGGCDSRCYLRNRKYQDDPARLECKFELMRDAMRLIKEQEKAIKEWEKYTGFLNACGVFDLADDGK